MMEEEDLNSILIVDDDELMRTTLSSALQRRAFHVEQAGTVAEALAVLKQYTPKFAVLDIRMPGGMGLELIEPILSVSPEAKVVVLTGYGSIATAVSAMKQGAFNYLTKPSNVDEILASFEDSTRLTEFSELKRKSLSDHEWEYLQEVLAECDGNITRAAKMLGIHRRSLQRKLNKAES